MRKPEASVITGVRAADGGAKLILQLEHMAEGEKYAETLTVFSARFDRPISKGGISEEEYERYCNEHLFCEAVGMGMRSLGAGTESSACLMRKLRARGVAPEVATAAAAELARRGYLDELSGAVRAAERGIAKYWGNRRILSDLKAKGYPAAALQAAAARLAEEDGAARLTALLHRRHIRAPQDERERAKLFASLTRYGYSAEEIRCAVQSVFRLS